MQDLSDLGQTQRAHVIQGQDDPLLLRQTGEQLCQCLRGHGSKITDTQVGGVGLAVWAYSRGARDIDPVLLPL